MSAGAVITARTDGGLDQDRGGGDGPEGQKSELFGGKSAGLW